MTHLPPESSTCKTPVWLVPAVIALIICCSLGICTFTVIMALGQGRQGHKPIENYYQHASNWDLKKQSLVHGPITFDWQVASSDLQKTTGQLILNNLPATSQLMVRAFPMSQPDNVMTLPVSLQADAKTGHCLFTPTVSGNWQVEVLWDYQGQILSHRFKLLVTDPKSS